MQESEPLPQGPHVCDDYVTIIRETTKAYLFLGIDWQEEVYQASNRLGRRVVSVGWFPKRCVTINDTGDHYSNGKNIYRLYVHEKEWFRPKWNDRRQTANSLKKLEKVYKTETPDKKSILDVAQLLGLPAASIISNLDSGKGFPNCMTCLKSNNIPHFFICSECHAEFEKGLELKIPIPSPTETIDKFVKRSKSPPKNNNKRQISLSKFIR